MSDHMPASYNCYWTMRDVGINIGAHREWWISQGSDAALRLSSKRGVEARNAMKTVRVANDLEERQS